MTIDELEKRIETIPEIAPHKDYLLKLARPSVAITITRKKPQNLQSRFGGNPMVPADFQWPTREIGEYKFLGHINFAEIEDRPASLPESGILALFYTEDESGELFWGDDGYILGYYWPEGTPLAAATPPNQESTPPKRIELSGSVDIPRHRELREDWPFDPSSLYELAESLPADYLLGYPSYMSLAYDPTPNQAWCSLLTLDSHEQFEWFWHDGDKLMLFIERDKLAARDFSTIKADAG